MLFFDSVIYETLCIINNTIAAFTNTQGRPRPADFGWGKVGTNQQFSYQKKSFFGGRGDAVRCTYINYNPSPEIHLTGVNLPPTPANRLPMGPLL